MRRMLILSVFPAPYRTKLFQRFKEFYDIDVFFERDNDDNRTAEWFVNEGFTILNTKEAQRQYRKAVAHIRKYDLVALYDYTSPRSILLIILCILLRKQFVVNCDGVILGKKNNKINDMIKKTLLPHAAACFASGQYAKQYFLSYGVREDKIHTHHFTTLEEKDILDKPISREEKNDIRSRFGIPEEGIIYIAVGRFIALKNYKWLLQGWPNERQFYLLLIGGGDEKKEYEEIVKERSLENVRIYEYMPKEEILSYLKAADYFIHPTTYDAWGLVINEALSQGIPCLVSNKCVAGLELIKDGYNGLLFDYDKNTVPEILVKSAELLNQSDNTLGTNSLESIRGYTYDQMAQTHLNVFNSLLSNNH